MNILKKLKRYYDYKKEKYNRMFNYKNEYKTKFIIQNFYSSDYNDTSDLDMVTVSFNSPKLIDYQIRVFKKMLQGNYRHIICDNSTIEENANEIKQICQRENVTYIRVQDRKIPKGYADSHGIALNWIYKNIIKKRENNFALMDHDVFPINKINVCDYLKENEIFGKINDENGKIWYLWPGFSFFAWKRVEKLKLNFRRYRKFFGLIKVKMVDTGSGNWDCLYSKYKIKNMPQCICELYDYKNNKTIIDNGNIPGDEIFVYIDNRNWLHMLDGGDRYGIQSEKTAKVYKNLDEILDKNVEE